MFDDDSQLHQRLQAVSAHDSSDHQQSRHGVLVSSGALIPRGTLEDCLRVTPVLTR